MSSLTPWRPSLFENFRDELDNLFERFLGRPLAEPNGETGAIWQPRCDVEETDKEILVKTDLPGVDPKGIEISIRDNTLTIHGEKKEEKEEKKKGYHRVERFTGQFYRELLLPAEADAEKITASSANGVVTVTIPKKPGAQAKKIAVKPEK
jgi:HSP20 family protein